MQIMALGAVNVYAMIYSNFIKEYAILGLPRNDSFFKKENQKEFFATKERKKQYCGYLHTGNIEIVGVLLDKTGN